ncbi:hypothetical protein G9C98_005280 [Cotesia typhae]|uniref:FMN hydroxy acid dehydrogenase domain-containing protein n=1 Tax=Cotesia typhae TaxID=2053667 RepID=A0A8J5V1S6_9HYME|nr:hypothetical protein G9C98_005280 [Cotesia typhae]
MEKFVSVDDYEKSALQILPKAVKDYYASGAGKEFSLQWNKDAFKSYKIRPKVLTNVLKCEIGTRILGEEISMPLGIAPTAMQGMAHLDGECATAKGKNVN